LSAAQVQFEVECLGAFKESVHVFIEEGHSSIEHTQSLPDSITQDEA